MNKLYDLKYQLMEELEEYADKKLSGDTLKTIDTLAHALKNLCKIIEEAEYSNRGGSYRSSYDNSYEGSYRGGSYDNSYRRNSMGRYSREEGYSRNDAIAQKVAMMANNTPDERTRRQLQELAKELENN